MPSTALLLCLGSSCLFIVGREVLKDVLDHDDDKLADLRTVATLWGCRFAGRVAAALILIAAVVGVGVLSRIPAGVAQGAGYALVTLAVLAVLWNSASGTRRSLTFALNGSALAMAGTVLIYSLPT
jgi:4-hydroxybenzoate polyprenyltransferase